MPDAPRFTRAQAMAGLRVGVFATVAIAWSVVAAACLVLSGVAGGDLGWLWCVLALAPVAALAWLLARRSPRRDGLTAIAAVLAVLLGLGLSAIATPSAARVDRVSRSLPLPAGSRELSAEWSGSGICFDTCTTVTRVYAVADADAALAALQAQLPDAGWRSSSSRWCRGSFGLWVGQSGRDGAIETQTSARC